MYAYPSATDAEGALALVWSKVSGGSPTAKQLAQAGWILEGYALDVGLGTFAPSQMLDPHNNLQALMSPHVLGDGTILKGLLGSLPTLLPIILQIIGTFRGGAPISGS